MTRLIQVVILLIFLVACKENVSANPDSSKAKISGTITYRERIALPPGASLQIKIISIRSDNAELIVRKTQLLNNAPPFAFDIEIPEKMRQSGEKFALQADIKRNDQVLFSATKPIDLVNQSKNVGEITVKRSKPPEKKDEKMQKLTAHPWQLIEIHGQPLNNPNNLPLPWLKFETNGRLLGFTGCNHTQGKYKLSDGQIQLRPGAVTNKFCAKSSINEQDFLDLLRKTTNIEISHQHLLLIGNDKSHLGVFQKQH
ncbi:MAG: META domain-containing protein [Cellvibrionales bacterium]|nr:META domain-containing protein [Cellvibrionales bacterium]